MCAKILRFLLKPLGRVLSIRASRVYTRLRKSSNNLPLPVASRSLASFSSAAAFSNSLFKLSISVFSAIIDNPANREKCNDYRKTLEHNYEILSKLEEFSIFQLPILVGVSRKSMIYKLLGGGPENALNGTTAIHAIALMKGANLLRVHDVKAAVETVRIFNALQNQ